MDILDKLRKKRPLHMAGLMSGTSMDGLDICLADVDFRGESVRFVIRGSYTGRFPPDLREAVRGSLSGPTELICRTHYDLGRFYSDQTKQFLSRSQIKELDAVGVHGQTVHHISGHATLQIGEPSFLAEELGVPVVSDFRARDISVGGTGAPLIAMVDKWIFQKEHEGIICLNLGGIANITYLPPGVSGRMIAGFDTGPGMALLDETFLRFGGVGYDEDGSLAGTGNPDKFLVNRWMEDDFVVRRPPKSTGRDRFGPQWVDEHVPHPTERSMEQVLASLSLFTARSVVVNCQQFLDLEGVSRIVVSGGGVHHRTVMTMLTQEFSPVEVTSSARFGVDPDIKEALGFAILAAAFLKEIPGNAPSVTGASRPVVLGKLTV